MDEDEKLEKFNAISADRRELLIKICARAILNQRAEKTRYQLESNILTIKRSITNLYEKSGEKEDIDRMNLEKEYIDEIARVLLQKREELSDSKAKEYDKIVDVVIQKYLHKLPSLDQKINDLSVLYDPTLLGEHEINGQKCKHVKHTKVQAAQSYPYQLEDEKITIKQIGMLEYTNWAGVEEYVREYLITRCNAEGNISELQNVFTDINISKMDDDEQYRGAVLGKLLSSKNLHKKFSHNYVGELVSRKNKDGSVDYGVQYSDEAYTAIVENSKQKQREDSIAKGEQK